MQRSRTRLREAASRVLRFFRREADPTIAAVYGAIVAQARHPAFYRDYGVADTVEGRFEMIVLHLALFLRRVRDSAERDLGQAVFDAFCRDMDHQLREMGVGDLSVPKKMRRIGEAFYGRAAGYDRALAGAGAELAAAIARNVFATEGETPSGARRLAAYVRAAERRLALHDAVRPASGAALDFPAPDTISWCDPAPGSNRDPRR